jgi:hypothetical protein
MSHCGEDMDISLPGRNVETSCTRIYARKYQRFGETYCLYRQNFRPEDGDSIFFRNAGT